MAVPFLETAPVLSTPDTHIFEDPTPPIDVSSLPKLPDEQLAVTYEIERTIQEIRNGKWRRIALQFPDHMLVDAPRIYQALGRGLKRNRSSATPHSHTNGMSVDDGAENVATSLENTKLLDEESEERLCILGDTSYGACCVDEVAAEHVAADVVVHYGRSCLSPTARLPVIYVFTTRPLDLESVVSTFKQTYLGKDQKIVLMADIPYSNHIPQLSEQLRKEGYSNIYEASILHDPSSPLPNRSVPTDVSESKEALREYQLFHISEPPTSLLLTLASRVGAVHIFPTDSGSVTSSATLASSAMTLRRRYALLTKLSTVPIFGILINTLSVKNYMHILDYVKRQIAAAGKKSYTFVVGKVNAAKLANFSEVGGWVVIGCWESSLIESRDFWKPIITPFELSLALKGDSERVWTGEWTSDFQAILEEPNNMAVASMDGAQLEGSHSNVDSEDDKEMDSEEESEEESAPPEFDLRTGRYVSHSRPMRAATSGRKRRENTADGGTSHDQSLARRANGDLAQIGGVVSPGAEFLRSQRTWQGLGSDFEVSHEEGAAMEQGRTGIARGYVVGDDRAER